MTALPRLVRKEFKAWLESKKPWQVVGLRDRFTLCPIARFLHQEKGIEHPGVRANSYGYYTKNGNRRGRKAPPWAEGFIHSVDFGPNTRITAARALKILEGK